jgi:hypothetical protein
VQEAKRHIDWANVDFSKSRVPKMQRQLMWCFGVCVRLSAPLMICAGFFVLMYIVVLNAASTFSDNAQLSYALEQRKVCTNPVHVMANC